MGFGGNVLFSAVSNLGSDKVCVGWTGARGPCPYDRWMPHCWHFFLAPPDQCEQMEHCHRCNWPHADVLLLLSCHHKPIMIARGVSAEKQLSDRLTEERCHTQAKCLKQRGNGPRVFSDLIPWSHSSIHAVFPLGYSLASAVTVPVATRN